MTHTKNTTRPPIVAVMGHIDHGKSTLLDYIRSTNIVAKEAGGITQRMSAYKVTKKDSAGAERTIVFLDTPGHEAFGALRSRGAKVADIAILVVATDEGVKPQTLDALKAIKEAGLPFIIAMNKIDKPNSDIEKTKQNLAENEIYVEGYGGDVTFVPISAHTGKGILDLLDLVLLQAEIQDLKVDREIPGEGIIIEAQNDKNRGVSGGLIIKNGTLKSGMWVVCEESIAPTRIMEDFQGKKISEAHPGDPIKIVGWNNLPPVGAVVVSFYNRKDAEKYLIGNKERRTDSGENKKVNEVYIENMVIVPVIIKASTTDVIEAIVHEIKKIQNERVTVRIISTGIGFISESDVKTAASKEGTVIVGFETTIDSAAKGVIERSGVKVEIFNIIYKLTEWLQAIVDERTPKIKQEEIKGEAKILKCFSRTKDKQVLGARVDSGSVSINDEVKIMRRDVEICRGKVRELQQSRVPAKEVKEGLEFGGMIEAKMDLAPGDHIQAFVIVER